MQIGKYPIIFFAVGTSISTAELNEMSELMARVQINETEKTRLAALKKQAKQKIPLAKRYPFVIDAKKVKLVPVSFGQQMNKEYTPTRNTEGGQYRTKPVKNTTTLAFQTTGDEIAGFILDSLFLLSDLSFFDPDLSPRISYFGGGISIPDGYLTNVSMSKEVSSNLVTLSLQIQRVQQQTLNPLSGQPPQAATAPLASTGTFGGV